MFLFGPVEKCANMKLAVERSAGELDGSIAAVWWSFCLRTRAMLDGGQRWSNGTAERRRRAVDGFEELFAFERLLEEGNRARTQSSPARLIVPVPSEHDNAVSGCGRREMVEQRKSTDPRHAQVEDEAAGALDVVAGEEGLSGVEGRDLVAN
jgi:hypothetical protein